MTDFEMTHNHHLTGSPGDESTIPAGHAREPNDWRTDGWRFVMWLGFILQTACISNIGAADESTARTTEHIVRLEAELTNDFHVIAVEPFVVIGNESRERVAQRANRTIRWAIDRLRQQFFTKSPAEVIEIWLLRDSESYERVSKERFGLKPNTPFGYYLPQRRAIIMNISTGSGTLVHELVHPFIAADFPDCPAWFNEGLASLYEQSRDHEGKIWGLPNWRLRGLHRMIGQSRQVDFRKLMNLEADLFYDDPSGQHYAQARYLCLYLQEQHLLEDYYREFRQGAEQDPTGYQALCRVIKRDDLAEFQTAWLDFVSKLEFP